MYTTHTIELSMNACAYQLERIILAENPHHVRKVYGRVPIAKKVTINGERKTIINYKKFRWNDAGQCFSRYSAKRQRKYDLPLRSIEEQQKQSRT